MLALIFEWGSITWSWYAELALRRRVKKSAIGSVIVMVTCQPFRRGSPRGLRRYEEGLAPLPAGLAHARQLPAVRPLPQADPAQAELAEHRARTPAAPAAGVRTRCPARSAR